METITISIDSATHASLLEMSEETGDTLTDTMRQAAEALRRSRFASRVRTEYASLRNDPAAWADYLAEAESSHVRDGIVRDGIE